MLSSWPRSPLFLLGPKPCLGTAEAAAEKCTLGRKMEVHSREKCGHGIFRSRLSQVPSAPSSQRRWAPELRLEGRAHAGTWYLGYRTRWLVGERPGPSGGQWEFRGRGNSASPDSRRRWPHPDLNKDSNLLRHYSTLYMQIEGVGRFS